MAAVLLTRPRVDSEVLAAALGKLGYQTVVEPLLTVEPLPALLPQASYDAVMITSGNALTALAGRALPADILGLPCFCVGPRTAERARAFGFRDVHSSASDGAGLARLIDGGPFARILHIAGEHAAGKARETLEGQGRRVTFWPVYRATAVDGLTDATRGLLGAGKIGAVMLYSPRTAATFRSLVEAAGLEACCAGLSAICLSEAVADVLKPLAWRHLAAAPAPTEDAMIASLQETLPA